jgi:hypothetical protein
MRSRAAYSSLPTDGAGDGRTEAAGSSAVRTTRFDEAEEVRGSGTNAQDPGWWPSVRGLSWYAVPIVGSVMRIRRNRRQPSAEGKVMPLVYVTGISASGKSAALRELRSRGFTAYGVDEDGYGRWLNRRSGAEDKFPHERQDLDMHQWFSEHEWVLDVEKIASLKDRSRPEQRACVPVWRCSW